VALLSAKVAELEGRLSLNSQNASKPPSSDGLGRPKPKSQRQKGLKSTGARKGHRGHTLKKLEQPDHVEPHPAPSHGDACHRLLTDSTVVETRQVFAIPPLGHEVSEHQVLEARWPCGKRQRGEFPTQVAAPVQYGPRIKWFT
jgi:transposase